MAGSAAHIPKPMSIPEIVATAKDFSYNTHLPLKRWLRTADLIIREARIYEGEGNDQQAYILYMRYITLIADILPTHPEAKEPTNKKYLRAAYKNIGEIVPSLEAMKPKLENRYNTWQQALERQKKARDALRHDISSQPRHLSEIAVDDFAAGKRAQSLVAADHGDLAVKLAHKEIHRRDTARRNRRAGLTEDEEKERRIGRIFSEWDTSFPLDKDGEDDDLQRRMEETRRRMERAQDEAVPIEVKKSKAKGIPDQPVRPPKVVHDYKYPSVLKSDPLQYETWRSEPQFQSIRESVPPIPAKERLYEITNGTSSLQGPQRPPKQELEKVVPSPTASPDTSKFSFQPSASLESGAPLRTVFLPLGLRKKFLEIAASNTRANLETLGVLCGALISNALFISHLVIPEQESTANTCETTNDSALFDYCDSEELMVFGWIHTHPTQTCFMSSRDLHTHSGYQVMIPESIAIVCAPSSSPSWGVFRLTDPPGLQAVLKCQQPGIFHPHEEENIYTDALRPGHVMESDGLRFEVVDLRPGH